jgi:hypothetical protein
VAPLLPWSCVLHRSGGSGEAQGLFRAGTHCQNVTTCSEPSRLGLPTTPLVLIVCVALIVGTIQASRNDVSLSWCVTTRFAIPFIFLSPSSADSDMFALFNAQPTVTLRCLRWPEHQDSGYSQQPDPQGDIAQTRFCSTFCKR